MLNPLEWGGTFQMMLCTHVMTDMAPAPDKIFSKW